MSQIKISCVGSSAVFTNTPDIFSGGNVDTVKFKFDKEWDGFTSKTAVFYTNPKETSLQILDSNNVATIPQAMVANKGKLSVGVIGTATNGNIKTSKILTYIVGKGAVTDDMETTTPTPDIWLQMLAIVEHNKQIVDNMELVVDESQMSNKANKDLSNVSVNSISSKGFARFKFGSYTGTGTYGSSNPNTLTFNFEPKFLFVTNFPRPIIIRDETNYNIAFVWGSAGGTHTVYFVKGEKSISWYSTEGSTYQSNSSDTKYYYIAIG